MAKALEAANSLEAVQRKQDASLSSDSQNQTGFEVEYCLTLSFMKYFECGMIWSKTYQGLSAKLGYK